MGGKGSGGQNRLSDEKREKVFQDLKRGRGVNETAQRQGVAHSTVARIRESRADDLPAWKRRTAAAMMETASELVEKVREDVHAGSGNLQQKSISLGILLDKASMLRDQPAMVVEHRHEIGQGLGGWLGNTAHQNAPRPEKAAEVVEIESISDEGGGSGEQRPGHGQQSSQQGAGGVENCAPSPPNMD